MKKYIILIYSFINLISFVCFGQNAPGNLNSVATPSAQSTNLVNSNGGNYNVGLYSGLLNYDASLFNISLAKINVAVELNYSAGGIKVQDQEGVVGTGWNLKAGGAITRVASSLPDEDPDGYCGSNNVGQNAYKNYSNTYFNNIISGTWDSEPDKFYFSFLNYSGYFVLDQNGNPVLRSSYGLQIIYSPFNRTNGRTAGGNEDWIIKDFEGNSYYFGDGAIETSNVVYHTNGSSKNSSYISSWYIKKIVTADNQTIDFTYNSYNAKTSTSYTNAYVPAVTTSGQCSTNNHNSASWNENMDVTITAPLALSKITYSIFEIDFLYDNSPYLNEIDTYQKGVLEFKYNFSYIGLYSDKGIINRLALSSIRQTSVTDNSQIYLYGFNYNTDQNLPVRNSIQTDFWGYYNNNPGSSNIQGYLNANKSPDALRAKANVLTSVTNQFGGQTVFDYESNTTFNGDLEELTGGIRIKSITNFSYGSVSGSTTYNYNDPNTGKSSGQLYANSSNYSLPVYYLLTNGSSACVISDVFYYSEPLSALVDLSGVITGYSYVTTKNADNSSIRYHFTNFSDYPDVAQKHMFYNNTQNDATGNDITPHFPLTSYAFARGKVASEESLDNNQLVIKRKDYTYGLSAPLGDVIGVKAYTQKYVNGVALYYLNNRYDFSTQDLLLQSVTETSNFYNGSTLTGSSVNTENYTYTNYLANNFLSSKSHILSNGNTEKTFYRYVFDILQSPSNQGNNASSPLSFMLLNKMIAHPLETVTTAIKPGSETVLSAELVKFTGVNTTVKPTTTYRLINSRNLLKSNYQNYQVTASGGSESEVIDNANLELVQLLNYDSKGNISRTMNPYTTLGQISTIYGYDQNLVTIQAKNAAPNEVFYDGLEASGTWPVTYDNNFKHSGLSSGRIDNPNSSEIVAHSNTILSVSLSKPTTYKYSGWIYSNKSSVDLYLFMKRTGENGYFTYVDNATTFTLNKWVYIEKEFTVPADVVQLNMRIDNNGDGSGGTGSVWFDDIRLHPANALLTSYSYEPLVGVIGSEDPKGQTSSNEYDGYKRLIATRDENGNIIKSYAYNKKSYPNSMVSQSFTKQNCSVGYAGSSVVYTVPFGKYMSGLSQQDADQQAQTDIQSNGQTFANTNGTCTQTNTPVSFNLVNSVNIAGYTANFSGSNSLSFSIPTNGSSTVTVPAGTYNISINPVGNYSVNHTFMLTGQPNVVGPGCSFQNIVVSPGNGYYLEIH